MKWNSSIPLCAFAFALFLSLTDKTHWILLTKLHSVFICETSTCSSIHFYVPSTRRTPSRSDHVDDLLVQWSFPTFCVRHPTHQSERPQKLFQRFVFTCLTILGRCKYCLDRYNHRTLGECRRRGHRGHNGLHWPSDDWIIHRSDRDEYVSSVVRPWLFFDWSNILVFSSSGRLWSRTTDKYQCVESNVEFVHSSDHLEICVYQYLRTENIARELFSPPINA